MNFALGLTGSVGMGKSTTAQLFARHGCQIWDADAAVHRLYAKNGAAVAPMAQIFPEAVLKDAVSRPALKKILMQDPNALAKIEHIVHPLVAEDRNIFRQSHAQGILVFDIPLLFENNAQAEFDAVACVFVDPVTQRDRVLNRPGMTEDQFDFIQSKQMPIEEKLKLSNYQIPTHSPEAAERAVVATLKDIKARKQHA